MYCSGRRIFPIIVFFENPSYSCSGKFVADKECLTSIDLRILKFGNPDGLIVSIIDYNQDTICQTIIYTSYHHAIGDGVWTNVEIPENIKLKIGQEYTIFIKPLGFCDHTNYYYCPYGDTNPFAYRLWTSDNYFTISDNNGNYSINVDRYSSGKLFAQDANWIFEPLEYKDTQQDITNQNFNGIRNPETATENIVANNNTRIWSYDKTIVVENGGKEIRIIDMSGRTIKNINNANQHTEIKMQKQGIYIVKTGVKTQKVIIK